MNWTDPTVIEFCRQHGEPDAKLLIVRLCRELLERQPTDAGPTPLGVLASCRGVRNIYCEPIAASGCSGYLHSNNGGYVITVNAAEPATRRNFSIAHEIVHTYFRDVGPQSFTNQEEDDLCDIGAAELTMPEARFRTHLEARQLCFTTIDTCRTEFDVSMIAASRRAIDLTSEAACLYVATPASSTQSDGAMTPSLRVTRAWTSPTWPSSPGLVESEVRNSSIAGIAFEHQDERLGHGDLGVAGDSRRYDIEARGYGYPLREDQNHRQVLVLAADTNLRHLVIHRSLGM